MTIITYKFSDKFFFREMILKLMNYYCVIENLYKKLCSEKAFSETKFPEFRIPVL